MSREQQYVEIDGKKYSKAAIIDSVEPFYELDIDRPAVMGKKIMFVYHNDQLHLHETYKVCRFCVPGHTLGHGWYMALIAENGNTWSDAVLYEGATSRDTPSYRQLIHSPDIMDIKFV